ncbi:ammonium transporter [Cyclobacterium amurskyense]|uniref:Ammonium transporter n=1 Tax=Cyclobacterium amurskyense TaxID=320787 RepID=A0A0H4PBR4_9BACT|nr:ammonium transporter [Cyclobacterium amurskyense]AKP51694.1 Ammonium transporter [Cyclobacterium amurskyense]|tara:strand:+ start:29821 stop:31053 length:1233 start_codon:yes stop_codon:yes gene_type:complete
MTQELFTINNLWIMVATMLVFIMHLGFAALEAGLTRAKNTVNILFKNTIIPALGLLTYAFIGFNLMYPGETFAGGIFGFAGLGLSLPEGWDTSAYSEGYTFFTDFIFQAMFAATAATIVSGAVAERIKLGPFIFFSLLYVGVCYPIVGMWKWGGGFLDALSTPFYDFAGSTIVHSVGGWGAVIGAYLLGPRIGKYKNGITNAIPGHNIPLAVFGVFLLWFGWFGFNGGSVLSADPGTVSLVFVTTSLAAAAGAFGALLASYLKFKAYDITMVLNGILAGLVSITAGADLMSPTEAVIIGFIGGILVVFGVVLFDKIKIDDPVGAIAVHLVCGIWGTLAVGIFGDLAGTSQILSQLIGIVSIGAFCITFSFLVFYALKKTVGIRVDEQEEVEGLDINEHGMHAYPDFETKE